MVSDLRDPKPPTSSPVNNNAMEKDIPSEAEMGALFEAAMRQQQKATKDGVEPKVTQDEQHKFLSAMKDVEFRSLLNDYMNEISDPQNRAETEQYLTQLENEQKVPTDKQLVKPMPGFVVKTKWEKTQKIFVNVCSSDKIQPPSSTKVMTDQQGTSWNLPYSLGPERLEPDKGGSSVPTFDVCFHPKVIEFARTRTDYSHMVVSTCLDAVEPILRETRRQPDALIARNYHVLKGVQYKSGNPVTMCLKKERDAPEPMKFKTKDVHSKTKSQVSKGTEETSEEISKESPQELKVVGSRPDDSVLNQLSHVEEIDKSSLLMKEVSSTKFDTKQQLEKKKMEHRLIYRGRFELLHHMQADPGKNVPEDRYRPKELVVEVNFPLSTSAKGLDLDVSERMLRLSVGSTAPGDYEPLELTLPFPVIEDKGTAKFDRKNHKLIVTLPVQPPPKLKPQSISLIVQDDEEEEEELLVQTETKSTELTPKQKKEGEDEFRMLRETALMVANDPQVLAYTERKTALSNYPAPAVITEPSAIKDDVFDDLPPLESCSGDEEEIDTTVESEEAIIADKSDLVPDKKQIVEPIKAPFETHTSETCLSYIVGVADINSVSVELTFPTTSSLKLEFSDNNKQVYEMEIAVLPIDIEPNTANLDVASENMVVILEKKKIGPVSACESNEKVVELDEPTSTLPQTSARFQNQLLYELD